MTGQALNKLFDWASKKSRKEQKDFATFYEKNKAHYIKNFSTDPTQCSLDAMEKILSAFDNRELPF